MASIDPARVKELVATLPANKRPAMAKVLKAACQHLRDSRKNYAQAFELAEAMIENWWRFGNDLKAMELSKGGRPRKTPAKMQEFTLHDLGVTYRQSSRSQKLAETLLSELLKTVSALRDEEKFFLPSLHTLHQHIHSERRPKEVDASKGGQGAGGEPRNGNPLARTKVALQQWF